MCVFVRMLRFFPAPPWKRLVSFLKWENSITKNESVQGCSRLSFILYNPLADFLIKYHFLIFTSNCTSYNVRHTWIKYNIVQGFSGSRHKYFVFYIIEFDFFLQLSLLLLFSSSKSKKQDLFVSILNHY